MTLNVFRVDDIVNLRTAVAGVIYTLVYNATTDAWFASNLHPQITENDISSGAVTSDKVDWETFKIPSPGEIVQSYGNVKNADKSFTMPSRGFFSCKTSVGIGDYVYIYINDIIIAGQYHFGGASGAISQVYVTFPVGVGDTVRVVASGANSLAEGIQLLSARWV